MGSGSAPLAFTPCRSEVSNTAHSVSVALLPGDRSVLLVRILHPQPSMVFLSPPTTRNTCSPKLSTPTNTAFFQLWPNHSQSSSARPSFKAPSLYPSSSSRCPFTPDAYVFAVSINQLSWQASCHRSSYLPSIFHSLPKWSGWFIEK